MKEQRKTSERELNEEIANLCDGEFKALVIKMLTELIELGWKMKDTQNELKQNIQGTNSDRKETRTQINDLEQKEEINIQLFIVFKVVLFFGCARKQWVSTYTSILAINPYPNLKTR